MRAGVLLGLVALLALVGAGCGSMPNQVSGDTGPPPHLSADRWSRVWAITATPTPDKGVDGAVFATPGGKMLVRFEGPGHTGWGDSWDLRPVGWPRTSLPRSVYSKTVGYSWAARAGHDNILTHVPKGRYYLNYATDRACTIAVYVER